jgi:hypothetical protein
MATVEKAPAMRPTEKAAGVLSSKNASWGWRVSAGQKRRLQAISEFPAGADWSGAQARRK